MAINFDWYTNPPRRADGEAWKEAQLHPRIHYNGSVSTRDLCEEISYRCTLIAADVTACLSALSEVMGGRLAEGQKIHLDGIGYFYPTLTTTEPVVSSTKHKTSKVKLKGIEFQPDKELKRSVVREGRADERSCAGREPYQRADTQPPRRILRRASGAAPHRLPLSHRHASKHLPPLSAPFARGGVLTNIGSSTQPLYVRGGERGKQRIKNAYKFRCNPFNALNKSRESHGYIRKGGLALQGGADG